MITFFPGKIATAAIDFSDPMLEDELFTALHYSLKTRAPRPRTFLTLGDQQKLRLRPHEPLGHVVPVTVGRRRRFVRP